MNTLILSRSLKGRRITGDIIMITETAAALDKLGIKVTVSNELLRDMNSFDVIHLFGTLDPYYTFLRLQKARSLNKPVVVSTIFWDWDPIELKEQEILRRGEIGYSIYQLRKRIQKAIPPIVPAIGYRLIERRKFDFPFSYYYKKLCAERKFGINGIRRFIYRNADVLLPNSYEEYYYLQEKFNISNDYKVVANGVNSSFGNGHADSFEKLYGIRDFVLCVAFLCSRKNQLRLIQAMRDIPVPLVLIGAEEKRYGMLCRAQASNNVYFLGQVSREDVKNAFAAARVHVLPSFYETPGIASLEAALACCIIVTTERGSTREYFRKDVGYCQPTSVDSIRKAITKALQQEPSNNLKQRIKRDYTWTQAAEATIKGYKIAMKKHKTFSI